VVPMLIVALAFAGTDDSAVRAQAVVLGFERLLASLAALLLLRRVYVVGLTRGSTQWQAAAVLGAQALRA